MKIRAEQLPDQIKKQLLPVYVISGGDPLLTQEAADSIRAGARAQGFSERDIFHAEGNFDWNQILNESNALSLFSDKKILEIRITNGKPGDKGAAALSELCAKPNPDNLVLVILPKLERGRAKQQVDENP